MFIFSFERKMKHKFLFDGWNEYGYSLGIAEQ